MATWQALFNRKYVHEEADTPMARDWMREFAKLTPVQLANGLARLTDFTGFFDQGAFIRLCREIAPESVGAPSVEKAYREACNARDVLRFPWSHPAVYHAGADCGWFDLRNGVGDTAKRFRDAYAERLAQAAEGTLPPVPKVDLLEQKPAGKASPETRQAHLAKLHALWGN